MKVFKFGGASVKDASGVKNVAEILRLYKGQKIAVVVSAMGKTTNALEKIADGYFSQNTDVSSLINELKNFHFQILDELFVNIDHPIYSDLNNTFVEIEWAVEDAPNASYDFEYDQIVSIGELLSSKILSAYLNEVGIENKWKDARDCIRTDNNYREGNVDFEISFQLAQENLKPIFEFHSIVVTQGFIGGTSENFTTTLGREGSDYTASILAWLLDAESMTIWKDVPGVLNADPRYFDKVVKLDHLSYNDSIELAYYGASVIHPKTIQPIQNKNIPLYVKSFISPRDPGTLISNAQNDLPVPCYIFKPNQILITIQPKDFSFIVEKNLTQIFQLLSEEKIKVNIMQNSAISFSVAANNDARKVNAIIEKLNAHFKIQITENAELITIRHYNETILQALTLGKRTLLEQKSKNVAQLLVK
jgi:aspartate kinase